MKKNYFQEVDNIESYDVRALRAVNRQINERLQVKPGWHILIVVDFATEPEMIQAFASAVIQAEAIPTILIMPNSGWDPWPLRLTPIAQNAITKGNADALIYCERSFVAVWGWERPTESDGKAPMMMYGSEQTWKYHGVFDIENGRIVSVDGSKDALIFKILLARIENMEQIVELAAGLTPGWMPDGSVHEEKRGLGKCHVTCGGWYPHLLSLGHVQPEPYMHIDDTVYCGTMEIDGKKVIEEGEVFV